MLKLYSSVSVQSSSTLFPRELAAPAHFWHPSSGMSGQGVCRTQIGHLYHNSFFPPTRFSSSPSLSTPSFPGEGCGSTLCSQRSGMAPGASLGPLQSGNFFFHSQRSEGEKTKMKQRIIKKKKVDTSVVTTCTLCRHNYWTSSSTGMIFSGRWKRMSSVLPHQFAQSSQWG